MTIKKLLLSSEEIKEGGQTLLTGSGTFIVPNGVTSLSVILIEGGGTGSNGGNFVIGSGSTGGLGGLGGKRRYLNSLAVNPGDTFFYSIGGLSANFGSVLTGTTGGVDAGRAGQGGAGGAAFSGQTTYGLGGSAGTPISYLDAEIDYPFLSVQAPTSSAVPGLFPGGGGGGGHGGVNLQGATAGQPGAAGAAGCIWIIWPGDARVFPRTRTAPEIPNAVNFDPRSLVTDIGKIATDGAGTWIGIDTSSIAGRRGRIFRSTTNGRSFEYLSTPVDTQLSGVAYLAGTWMIIRYAPVGGSDIKGLLKSTDGGLTWAATTVTIANLGNVLDLNARNGRFFAVGSNSLSTGNKLAYTNNAGTSWGAVSMPTSGSPVERQARILCVTDTVLLLRRSFIEASKISRDRGGSWSYTDYTDAAKLGSVSVALKNASVDNAFANKIFVSNDDLISSTEVPGITLSSQAVSRLVIPLSDRILVLDGNVNCYQYKDGSWSTTTKLPIELSSIDTPEGIYLSPGLRVATDGIDSILTALSNGYGANFRSNVYVS